MPIYFHMNNEASPLGVETIGCNWLQPGVQRNEGYPHYHWLQTESGCGQLRINEQRFNLPPGCGVLLAPFVPHGYYSLDNWQVNFLTFHGTLQEDIRKIVGTEPFFFARDSDSYSFQHAIQAMIALHSTDQTAQRHLSVLCYEFLLNIGNAAEQENVIRHPLFVKHLQPIIKYIETNYDQELSAEQLAAEVFVSPQYLARLFQRFLGKSTYRYLTDYRLNKSKELLVNYREKTIQEVSYLVGFRDVSNFIAAFRKNSGMTPKEFRNLHW